MENNAFQETRRIEAFSDGVFAIALTLLVLDLKVPQVSRDGQLLSALLAQWPTYLAFLASFATIAIMWINHHRLFNIIQRADDGLMAFNCLLLIGISVVPFTTALLSSYIGRPDEQTAAQVYTINFVIIAIFFNLVWRYAAYKNRLLDLHTPAAIVRAIDRSYLLGPLLYLASFGFTFLDVTVAVLITILLAVFFAIPVGGLLRLFRG